MASRNTFKASFLLSVALGLFASNHRAYAERAELKEPEQAEGASANLVPVMFEKLNAAKNLKALMESFAGLIRKNDAEFLKKKLQHLREATFTVTLKDTTTIEVSSEGVFASLQNVRGLEKLKNGFYVNNRRIDFNQLNSAEEAWNQINVVIQTELGPQQTSWWAPVIPEAQAGGAVRLGIAAVTAVALFAGSAFSQNGEYCRWLADFYRACLAESAVEAQNLRGAFRQVMARAQELNSSAAFSKSMFCSEKSRAEVCIKQKLFSLIGLHEGFRNNVPPNLREILNIPKHIPYYPINDNDGLPPGPQGTNPGNAGN